jgi:Family of unknown function (DUF6308)
MSSAFPKDPGIFLDEYAAPLVREYFARDDGRLLFSGALFERLGGGGDRPEVANRFTPDDIVAAKMLSVEVPRDASLWLLAGC